MVIVQSDALNRSRLATAVCVPLTSNLRWADAPGNVLLPAGLTGLSKDSVALTAQLIAIDRSLLIEHAGRLPRSKLKLIFAGIDVVLGR